MLSDNPVYSQYGSVITEIFSHFAVGVTASLNFIYFGLKYNDKTLVFSQISKVKFQQSGMILKTQKKLSLSLFLFIFENCNSINIGEYGAFLKTGV